jgi:hypothetical protein
MQTVIGNGSSLKSLFACGFSHKVCLCMQLLVVDVLSSIVLHMDSLTRFSYGYGSW